METYWLEQNEADLPTQDDWLSLDEAALMNRMRFAKRRADWRLGRWTAKRAAAAYLNLAEDPRALREIEIRAAPSGAPELFLASRPALVTISISHRSGIAVCAIAMDRAALGCDLELIEPRDAAFVADYFTEEEQELISRLPAQEQPRLVTLLWSAKESTLKALRRGLRLATRSLGVTFEDPTDHEPAADVLRQSSKLSCWRPLRVAARGELFRGWWQSTGQLMRTLVGSPSPLPPVFLEGCAASVRPAEPVTS